jgi:ribosomal protein S4
MKWYLPVDLPNLKSRFKPDASAAQASSEEGMPISSLIFRDVERRLDTIVFRCCFARSAREARAMVVNGKVQVNGIQVSSA